MMGEEVEVNTNCGLMNSEDFILKSDLLTMGYKLYMGNVKGVQTIEGRQQTKDTWNSHVQ